VVRFPIAKTWNLIAALGNAFVLVVARGQLLSGAVAFVARVF
jgi:hypothetical protein